MTHLDVLQLPWTGVRDMHNLQAQQDSRCHPSARPRQWDRGLCTECPPAEFDSGDVTIQCCCSALPRGLTEGKQTPSDGREMRQGPPADVGERHL